MSSGQSAPLFAVVGDVHGAMHAMIRLLCGWEKSRGRRLDFVLQVGDFEPHRDEIDLATMAAPAKYRKSGDFPMFSRGEAHFPWPLYFIGGNHEPYGFLQTLEAGGEAAPNCYFLGRAGLIEIAGLRVAGLSGIFQPQLFDVARPALDKFGTKSNKDWIGWNEGDIEKLLQMGRADVFLLHEWPLQPFNDRIRAPEESGAHWIELALASLQPRLICCGHAHFRWRGNLGAIPVECLAQVSGGRDAFSVLQPFDGSFREIA